MRSSQIIARQHKARRFFRWLCVWLVWWVPAISVWFVATGARDPRRIDRVARGVCDILFLMAHARAPAPPRSPKCYGKGRAAYASRRSVYGARLHKAVRARDLPSRVFAILKTVRDAKAHVAALVRRLTRGVTRSGRKVRDAVLEAELNALCVQAARSFDTS